MAQGKRVGSRRGAKPPRRFRPALLVLAVGVTLAVVAWGYLVYAAIDFGTEARGGRSAAWWFLALASLGAVACLFIALILVARLSRALGITAAPEPVAREPRTDPRAVIDAATETPAPRHAGPATPTTARPAPPENHDPDPPTGSHRAIR